jgi:hypothetical protein
MNIIVDSPQLVRVVIQYLNMKFGNLIIKTSSEYLNSIFYVDSDNEVMMEYDEKKHNIFIKYKEILSKISFLFHLDEDYNAKLIIRQWLEETYNIRDIKYIASNPALDWTFENAINLD